MCRFCNAGVVGIRICMNCGRHFSLETEPIYECYQCDEQVKVVPDIGTDEHLCTKACADSYLAYINNF